MKNRIILFITIIVCFLLQCTVMDRISIGSITPNLLLILCVSMGLMRGRKVGLWTGFFSGLFVDLFYGSLFGFYALIYMYIGFISGYAFRSFYDDDLKVPLFLVAGTDLLYIWLCMASSFCSEAVLDSGPTYIGSLSPKLYIRFFSPSSYTGYFTGSTTT